MTGREKVTARVIFWGDNIDNYMFYIDFVQSIFPPDALFHVAFSRAIFVISGTEILTVQIRDRDAHLSLARRIVWLYWVRVQAKRNRGQTVDRRMEVKFRIIGFTFWPPDDDTKISIILNKRILSLLWTETTFWIRGRQPYRASRQTLV
jgi:Tfp pilus assembly protein PilZ